MLHNLSLGQKFSLLLALVLLFGLVIGGLALRSALDYRAQGDFATRGILLLEMMNQVRSYTDQHVAPHLSTNDPQAKFISESVPNFAAHTVFDLFRTRGGQGDFIYKEAVENPRRPEDRADSFEATIIDQLRTSPQIRQLTGFRLVSGANFFYVARPIVVSAPGCLNCHGDPAAAPRNMIAVFGSTNGFGWQLDKMVGTQIIYVPAAQVENESFQAFLLVMAIFTAAFVLAILVINLALRRYVLQPIGVLGSFAHKLSADDLTLEDLNAGPLSRITAFADELGQLAKMFRQMAGQVVERARALKEQVEQLRIEIDQTRRQRDVQAIVESDAFHDLKTKGEALRKQREQREGNAGSDPTSSV